MKNGHVTCPSCGARIDPGADTCGLCGMSISEGEKEVVETEKHSDRSTLQIDRKPEPSSPSSETGPFCNQCGWKNPAGARFCSRCGTRLQALAVPSGIPVAPGKPAKKKPRDQAATALCVPTARVNQQRNRRILYMAAGLLALCFYLITQVKADQTATVSNAVHDESDHTHAPTLSVETARRALELEKEINELDGAERLARQRELVQLFVSENRYDRAAVEQEKVAAVENTTEAWTLTGNYFYDWAAMAPPEQRAEPVQRAVAAYQRVLEEEPGNLDIRTDMAALYQWDPEKLSVAIEETRRVIDANPNHVQANFNMGIFLMRSDRMDDALRHFGKVLEVEPRGSTTYDRAQEIIQHVQEHAQEAGF